MDHGDAFLDTDAIERARGITIYTEPAVMRVGDVELTILDTPGHVDVSAETERTLQALDYAILVVSAADGVQGHTDAIERARGITIYTEPAVMRVGDVELTILDTPGHVDFSAETERTLQALDYAILVVSAADGVQGHTLTLWRLLQRYHVPVFVFVKKMDAPGACSSRILDQLHTRCSEACIDFTAAVDGLSSDQLDALAMQSEAAMDEYRETGGIDVRTVRGMIADGAVVPVYFGVALKMQGISEFLEGFAYFTREPHYTAEFGARVFKISHDRQRARVQDLARPAGQPPERAQSDRRRAHRQAEAARRERRGDTGPGARLLGCEIHDGRVGARGHGVRGHRTRAHIPWRRARHGAQCGTAELADAHNAASAGDRASGRAHRSADNRHAADAHRRARSPDPRAPSPAKGSARRAMRHSRHCGRCSPTHCCRGATMCTHVCRRCASSKMRSRSCTWCGRSGCRRRMCSSWAPCSWRLSNS